MNLTDMTLPDLEQYKADTEAQVRRYKSAFGPHLQIFKDRLDRIKAEIRRRA